MAEQFQLQHRHLHPHPPAQHQPLAQLQQHAQHSHQLHQLSPDRALASLPESYLQTSTPQCSCPMQRTSPCSPSSSSSSLLSFADSSASFSSDLESRAASPQAVRLAVGRRRLRLMQREEGQLRRLIADLDSRMRLAGDASGTNGVDKDLQALRRMSVEGVLHTVQRYAAVQSAVVAAASLPLRDAGGKCESESDSENCSLLDF